MSTHNIGIQWVYDNYWSCSDPAIMRDDIYSLNSFNANGESM